MISLIRYRVEFTDRIPVSAKEDTLAYMAHMASGIKGTKDIEIKLKTGRGRRDTGLSVVTDDIFDLLDKLKGMVTSCIIEGLDSQTGKTKSIDIIKNFMSSKKLIDRIEDTKSIDPISIKNAMVEAYTENRLLLTDKNWE